ncbi:hypothetical protein P280DRAFT_456375 [Massarina eburnea CBS 473.64]|uniref:ABM domain-containing protein n=1 Tax=Massarina eburnea CBS 473.64 TaxID=1395130 RepID=A0A6A6RW07_9PLEO|nr:hypothetical protein P280DRAFT_456375 [Massarina eburnea CBS 473.64]
MATETPSISIHLTFFIDPAKGDEFLAALRPVFEAVTAEPKNIFFEVYTSPDKPGVFKFVENWNATVDWMLTVQLAKDYYKAAFAVVDAIQVKDREYEIWTRMSGTEWVFVGKEMLS